MDSNNEKQPAVDSAERVRVNQRKLRSKRRDSRQVQSTGGFLDIVWRCRRAEKWRPDSLDSTLTTLSRSRPIRCPTRTT
jgi:hypothetical protein